MSIRKFIARNQPTALQIAEAFGAVPLQVYEPDLSADSDLYRELDSLNEVSVALSKHQLADIARLRLQEVSGHSFDTSALSDDDILDCMLDKNDSISQVYAAARSYENSYHDQMQAVIDTERQIRSQESGN